MMKTHDPETATALATIFALPALEDRIEGACALAIPEARPVIVELFHQWNNDPRKALSRNDCMAEGNWGASSQALKEQEGDLFSFLDGKKRLISVESFYRHLITRVILSRPAGRPQLKATNTRTRFKSGANTQAASDQMKI
jgi:hypothetical protein